MTETKTLSGSNSSVFSRVSGSSAWKIASVALPLYVTMVAASAGALVDTAVLGRHGTVSLAAFAVTIAVYSPSAAAVAGAMRGVMPFVAAHREDPDELLPMVRDAKWLGLGVGLTGAVAVAAVPLIGRLGGVPASTLEQLGIFPWLLAASLVVTSLGSASTSTLVGLGQGKSVMRAGLAGTGTAVVLSLLLVGGVGSFSGLGLPGAGLAMLASSSIGASWAHRALRRSPALGGRPLVFGPLRPREVLRIARVGIPLAATVLIKFAVLGVIGFSAARTGTRSAAAHSISLSLVNLMFTAAVAVGQATVPLMAGHVRAGEAGRIRRVLFAGASVALGAVVVLGTVLLVLRRDVVSVYTDDPVLRERVTDLLPLVLLVVATDALQAVFGFGLIGLKRTVPSLAVFAAAYGALAALTVAITASGGGLTSLWTALACANLALLAGQAFFFHRHSGRVASS
ncbi:MATE family efflux transporter [Streptomyces sp. NBC_01335]|uniref:MATE family efflux transporter n=1 Tax=Streptomyces sp. NBC_01335 TaxID=2903828 RepID=UPI002E15F091|nr:MATE family efflux transporter [Streptomyces sp. NBC_01335]